MRRVDVHPFGWLSILPPVLAIGLAVASRRALPALLAGIWVGWLITAGGRPLAATGAALRGIGGVLADPGQARVVLFTVLMGVLIEWIRQSGGIDGFLDWIRRRPWSDSPRGARMLAAAAGLGIFVESTITCLVVGVVARPLFDRHRLAREKLAYICDATSAPVCMLIPLNSWGAVVLALLAAQAELGRLGDGTPLGVFLTAVPLNFYAMLSVLLVFAVAATGYDAGPMRGAERRARESGPTADERASGTPTDDEPASPPPDPSPSGAREAPRAGRPGPAPSRLWNRRSPGAWEAEPARDEAAAPPGRGGPVRDGGAAPTEDETARGGMEGEPADDRPRRARHLAVPLAVMMGRCWRASPPPARARRASPTPR